MIPKVIAAIMLVRKFKPGITLKTSAIMATAYIDYIILTHADRPKKSPLLRPRFLLSES